MDALRFGRQFRALRIRLRRRQADVAADARLSRTLISSIDRGRLDGVTIGAVVRASAALGADVDIRLRWRGEQLDRLLDQEHAAVVETIVGRLARWSWTVEVETSFSIWGERGSIDVLAFHPRSGALLVVEAKSVVPDSQATIHGLDRKTRLAGRIAEDRGWTVRHTSRLLVIAAAATARRRIEQLEATYGVAFPARGTRARDYIARPEQPISGLLFVSTVSHNGTSRRGWSRERVRGQKQAHSSATRTVGTVPGSSEPRVVD